jgi:hypothetical protein
MPPDEVVVTKWLRDLIAEVSAAVWRARTNSGAPIEIHLTAPGSTLKRVTLHVPSGHVRPVVVDVRREDQ